MLNVISGGFASGGETSVAREVYTSEISGTARAGKRPKKEGKVVISFLEVEMKHATFPHEYALVITVEINWYDMKRVMIYSGSSTDVLFLDALKTMGKSEKDIKIVNFPLMRFASTTTYLVGAITLSLHLGEGWKARTINVTFIVVDAPASNNAVFGHSTLNPHRMVHSTYHQLIKFLTPHDIGVVRGDQPVACVGS